MKRKGILFLGRRWFPLVVGLTLGCNLLILLIPSCKSSADRTRPQTSKNQKEDLIRNQQSIVKNESDDIDEYITRRNYKMTTTKTGLRYQIYQNGTGSRLPVTDDYVKINYTVSLLDGTKVYSSDSTGAMEFQIGKSDIASGLQEGIQLMKQGDKAIFIVPSHLAYGLTGDGDQIKNYQALVIDAELLSISNKK